MNDYNDLQGVSAMPSFEEEYPGSTNSWQWMRGEEAPGHSPAFMGNLTRISTEHSDISGMQPTDFPGNSTCSACTEHSFQPGSL